MWWDSCLEVYGEVSPNNDFDEPAIFSNLVEAGVVEWDLLLPIRRRRKEEKEQEQEQEQCHTPRCWGKKRWASYHTPTMDEKLRSEVLTRDTPYLFWESCVPGEVTSMSRSR
jgi:hypothetical protein